MATMRKLRLADANLNIKIRELLEGFGFSVGGYTVLDSFPNIHEDEENLNYQYPTLPTVVVKSDTLFGTDVEVGSSQWKNLSFTLDIYAKSDGQRDDIADYLFDNLNDKSFIFYDFNDGFPDLSVAVSYTGLTQDGSYYVENVTTVPLESPPKPIWEGEKHHQLVFGVIRLGNN